MAGRLLDSTVDKVQLSREVCKKFIKVVTYAKSHSELLDIPPEVHRAIKLTNKMYNRYRDRGNKFGVYQHTHEEMMAEQTFCKWLVEKWHKMNGTKQQVD